MSDELPSPLWLDPDAREHYAGLLPGSRQAWSLGSLLSGAWSTFTSQATAFVASAAILIALDVASRVFDHISEDSESLTLLLMAFAVDLFGGVLAVAFTQMCAHALLGRPVAPKDLLRDPLGGLLIQLKLFAVLAGLFVGGVAVYVVGAVLFPEPPGWLGIVAIGAGLLALLWILPWLFMVSLELFVGRGRFRAVWGYGRILARGQRLRIWGGLLLSLLIVIAGYLALGLGALVAIPTIGLFQASIYLVLRDGSGLPPLDWPEEAIEPVEAIPTALA